MIRQSFSDQFPCINVNSTRGSLLEKSGSKESTSFILIEDFIWIMEKSMQVGYFARFYERGRNGRASSYEMVWKLKYRPGVL